MSAQLLFGFLAAAIVAYAAWKLHALDLGGAVAAVLAGTFIFGYGGIGPSAALIMFFITGSVLSSLPLDAGKRRRRTEGEPLLRKEEIGGGYARNWRQVAANGGIPLALVLAAHFFLLHPTLFLHAYYGAIAAMCADSWGTEVGTRYGTHVRSALSGQELPLGESGGVSVAGMAGSIGGAMVIGVTAGLAGGEGGIVVTAIVLAGTLGAISDSIIGGAFQAKFGVHGEDRIIESPDLAGSGRDVVLVSGFRGVTNNTVNLTASAIGSLIIVILLYAQ